MQCVQNGVLVLLYVYIHIYNLHALLLILRFLQTFVSVFVGNTFVASYLEHLTGSEMLMEMELKIWPIKSV